MAQPSPMVQSKVLPMPPSFTIAQLASLNEPITASAGFDLYLQAFDNQPGISIPFRNLDYQHVRQWLSLTLSLDPDTQYPLLMATHLYSRVPDETKTRLMLDWVYGEFEKSPGTSWRWLADAAVIAKHKLHDLPLALKYAQAIAAHSRETSIPSWASQMPIFIMEDMGETKSAKIMLGALLANNGIKDPHERHFLIQEYEKLTKKMSDTHRSR